MACLLALYDVLTFNLVFTSYLKRRLRCVTLQFKDHTPMPPDFYFSKINGMIYRNGIYIR